MTDEFDVSALDDGRGQFTIVIRARAPRSLHEDTKQAAAAEGVGFSEFVRRALTDRIKMVKRQRAEAA